MPLNYTPLSWKNVDPSDPRQMKVFLLQLSDFLNSAFNPSFLSFALNGQGLLSPGSMSSASKTLIGNNTGSTGADAGLTGAQTLAMLSQNAGLGSVSTNQSVACDNAAFVFVSVTITASITLTFTHISPSAQVFVVVTNSTAGGLTIKFAGTTPAGGSVATISAQTAAHTTVDMIGAGVGVPASSNNMWIGAVASTNNIFFLVL